MKAISNSHAQIILYVEIKRRLDALCIDRRHLLSVTYFREMRDGEHEPIYKLVEQAEIYLNLKPFASNFDLQVLFVAKADEHIEINDHMYSDEQQLPEKVQLIKRTVVHEPNKEKCYAIEALPLSYRLPDAPTIETNPMQKSKRWTAPRPYVAIDQKKKVSIAEKVAQLEKIEWLKDWIIQPRQRKNGKYDLFYYHRKFRLMCRSLVEVHNFERHGTRPNRSSRRPKKDTNSPAAESSQVNVNKQAEPVIVMKSPKKRTFEIAFSTCNSSQYPTENRTCDNDTEYQDHDAHDDYDYDDDDDDDEEEQTPPVQTAEEFLKKAYNNLLMAKWDPNYVTSDYQDVNSDYEAADDDDQPPISVEEFLSDSYSNLLNSTTGTASKSKASKGNKRRRVEETSKAREGKLSITTAAGNLFQGSRSAEAKDHMLFDVPVRFKPYYL